MPAKGILITGVTGQVGGELVRRIWPASFQPVAVDSRALDLRNTAAIAEIVARGHDGQPWAAVVNAAAYTAVDKAESEPVEAWQVNALAPAAFGRACALAGIPILHLSTDYVFDGSKSGGWEVGDPVAPLNVYGASKLGGELALRTSGARCVIVRTSWVISVRGNNFVKSMLRLADTQPRVRIVADQLGSPTSAVDLAEAVKTIALRLASDPSQAGATVHFSNAGETSWAEFAAEIFRQSAQRAGPSAIVEEIGTDDFPTAAKRPRNSLLDHSAIEESFGIRPRPWREALNEILDELVGEIK